MSRLLSWALLFAGLVAVLTSAAESPRPNVIFILADDLGYGDLGCYGQKLIQTPNLDRMANEGTRFTRFYAGSTVCAPSRSVLMTGKHTGHTTVRGNGAAKPGERDPQSLRDEDVTVAEIMKKAGYRTGLIGKWGLGMPGNEGHPNKQGFDYFYGFLSQVHAHNHFPDFLWRNGEKVSLPNKIIPVGTEGAGYATHRVLFAGDSFAQEALKFVDENQGRPFFLYLALTVPHANNERTRALGNGAEVPDFGPYTDKPWSDQLKGQAAMITRMDSDIGKLMTRLRELNIATNTLVFFSSDNGPHKESGQDPAFFEPGGKVRGYKRDLYEGGIRVPFLAWWPGTIKPGESGHVAYFGDLMATLADLTGTKTPGNLDSISFLPLLLGKPQIESHKYLYWEFHENGFSQAVLIDGRWKGIRLKRLDAPIQIFDLATDPSEEKDLAASEPERVAEVRRLFSKARTESELWPIKESAKP